MRIRFHWFALLWISGWSAVTLMADFTFGGGVIAQARSYGFSEVTGRIISSEVVRQRQSRGRHVVIEHVPQIRYEYQAGGLRHSGERVRFGQGGDARDDWARRVVRENRPGAQRPVYYNPATPAEAVLYTGFDGPTLLLALFLTPFNVVMVGGPALIWNWVRPLGPRGGARVTTLGARTRVQLTSFPPCSSRSAPWGSRPWLRPFPWSSS